MKMSTIKGLWLLHWCSKFHIDISSRLWVNSYITDNYRVLKRWKSGTHARTHTYIRTLAKNHISQRFGLFLIKIFSTIRRDLYEFLIPHIVCWIVWSFFQSFHEVRELYIYDTKDSGNCIVLMLLFSHWVAMFSWKKLRY